MAGKQSRRERATFDRRLMERQLSAMSRLLAERRFDTLEAANACLQRVVASGDAPVPVPETPLERAQELVYRALETAGDARPSRGR